MINRIIRLTVAKCSRYGEWILDSSHHAMLEWLAGCHFLDLCIKSGTENITLPCMKNTEGRNGQVRESKL